MSDSSDKQSRSLRALDVIEAVVSADRPLSVVDLLKPTGLPKATLHRQCNLLEAEGYLRMDIDGRGYVGGHRLRRLADLALAATVERSYRHGILASVSQKIGETCNIAIPRGIEMYYTDRVETKWPLRHQLPIGSNVPCHCTASGKLYLSTLTPRRSAELLPLLPLQKFTRNTINNAEDLQQALVEIRSTRVGIDDEEFIDGMVALAVPINDEKGRMVAALAFHAPTVRMDMETARSHLPALQKAALALSVYDHE